MAPEVVSICLAQRLAILADGRQWPITTLIDRLGEETDDPSQAVAFVCGDDREWISAPVSDFEQATVH